VVILTISDFYTRMVITTNNAVKRVFGGLLGQTKGDVFEIYSAFEFYNSKSERIELDLAYIDERKKMTEQLYPNYELLGYFTTNESTKFDCSYELINTMDYFGVVSPICLVLSTNLEGVDELPITCYEVDKTSHKKLDHILEGAESERICLDSITKSTDFQTNESAMIQNMQTLNSASDVLKSNLKLIREALKSENFRSDPYFISLVNDLINNYPNSNSEDLNKFLREKEIELMVLNNICVGSIISSHQARIEGFNKLTKN
jgi:hypothetical protein